MEGNNSDEKSNIELMNIKEKNKKNDDNNKKNNNLTNKLSNNSLIIEGAKYPLSLYTRRVINISHLEELLNENSSRGVCGGKNLGNTCFMNSSIACISNCTELTYYFLSGDYKKDINTENENGMNGKLAEKWAELLQQYWIKSTKVGNPQEFKYLIGQKVGRFRGYGQQDSNEFMNIFLDYLNEDLNKTTKKEYIELSEKKGGETDEECSKRYWESNLNRNDSIITDLFCGQFKSTLTCPKCNNISVTFEPFNSIYLPIKKKKKKFTNNFVKRNLDYYQFFYVPKYGIRNSYQIEIKDIPNTTRIGECFGILKEQENFGKLDDVSYIKICFKICKGEIEEDEVIDESSQNIFLYELVREEMNCIKIPIYFLYSNEQGNPQISQYPRILFGTEDMTLKDFRKNIYFLARKYILSPFIRYDQDIDDLSEEINKYISDFNIEDDYIFDLIEKEYNKIFNEDQNEEEIEQLIEYMKDAPFKLTLREWGGSTIINIFRDDNLNMLTDEFKEVAQVNSLDNTIGECGNNFASYGIVIEFNNESKYINKNNFKLNKCLNKVIEYEKKGEEIEKDYEEEDEDNNHKPTLEEYLKMFCKEEQLKKGNNWFCNKCKENVLPKKKIDIYYLPKILIICFSRFSKELLQWEKNDEYIEFPIKNFNMKDLMIGPDKDHSIYDLFAVSQHYGETGGGHYTAICQNGNNWYKYDDATVTKTIPKAAVSSAAYVLFYRRQTD